MIAVDTSVVVAYMNAADDWHDQVVEWLASANDDLATTPLIVAETDHLVSRRGTAAAVRALREDLRAGAYLVEWWPEALNVSIAVADRYAGIGLGLADASLVALADHLRTTELATLDERHFRTVRPLAGGDAFRLLPADR